MECNRDEALRSREIAEQKFLQHDFIGAKKFALKAQHLFPDLEGLPQLMAVLDVHIVAQDKVNGVEINWYGILQTDATADAATIRRQYRKLALVLHPDKNKAVGAEGAFKLISEAWAVLSDKERKAAHDARRKGSSYNTNWPASTKSKAPSEKPSSFSNFTYFSNASWMHPKSSQKSPTFWTACPFCRMQFEYKRAHENQKLTCATCQKLYIAVEITGTCSNSFHNQARQPGKSSNEYKPSWNQSTHRAGENVRANASSQSNEKIGGQTYSVPPKQPPGHAAWEHQPCPQGKDGPFHHETDDSTRKASSCSKANFSFYLAAHRNKTVSHAAAKATAEMVQQTYETVRQVRVKAQKEAREKVLKEKMEAQKEAWRKDRLWVHIQMEARRKKERPLVEAQKDLRRKDRMEQKHKRRQEDLDREEKDAAHAKKLFDNLFARGSNGPLEHRDTQIKVESESTKMTTGKDQLINENLKRSMQFPTGRYENEKLVSSFSCKSSNSIDSSSHDDMPLHKRARVE